MFITLSRRFACCSSKKPINLADNYFRLFRLPESYSLNGSLLEKKYKDFQKVNHPDVSKKENAEELSAHINTAYATLKHPLRRAIYVLQLKQVDLDIADVEEEFLEKVVELKTQIEGMDEAAKRALEIRLREIYGEFVRDFTEHLEAGVMKEADF